MIRSHLEKHLVEFGMKTSKVICVHEVLRLVLPGSKPAPK